MTDPAAPPSPAAPAAPRRMPLVLIVLIILIVVSVAAVLLMPRSPAAVARVSAVKAAEGLPTYLSLDAGAEAGLAAGSRLVLLRDGRPVATLAVELADQGRATARVLDDTWAAGATRTVAVGDAVAKP